jgi:hypothetical protein
MIIYKRTLYIIIMFCVFSANKITKTLWCDYFVNSPNADRQMMETCR